MAQIDQFLEEILRRRGSDLHFIALGHVHLFSDVSRGATRAFYCGTPAPLYAGSPAGCVAYVNCEAGRGVTVEQVTVAR